MPWHPFLTGYEIGEISSLENICRHIPKDLSEDEYTKLLKEKRIEIVCVWLKWSSYAPTMCLDCGGLAIAMETELLKLDEEFTKKYGDYYFYKHNWKKIVRPQQRWDNEIITEFNKKLMLTEPWKEWFQRTIQVDVLPSKEIMY